jgi:hypothetical protein
MLGKSADEHLRQVKLNIAAFRKTERRFQELMAKADCEAALYHVTELGALAWAADVQQQAASKNVTEVRGVLDDAGRMLRTFRRRCVLKRARSTKRKSR